jgi:hypothetical protein
MWAGSRAGLLASILSAAGLLAACGESAPSPASTTSAAQSPVTASPVVSRSSRPSSQPPSSPPSATVTFVSERYRYSVEVPRFWKQTRATTDWHGTERLTDLSTALDRFDDNPAPGAEGHFLGIASQPVDAPSWLQTYTAANDEKFASVCPDEKHAWISTTVHGNPGVALLLACLGAFIEYVFVEADHAWIVSGSPDAVETALRTFELRP